MTHEISPANLKKRKTTKSRECLGCGHMFMSQGIGNRRCDKCKDIGTGLHGEEFTHMRPRRSKR